jgi:tRNA(fMet)-specific endonuclease VapC
MTLWIIDTDHVSLLQRSHPNVKQQFNQLAPEEIGITIVTVYEQVRGWQNLIHRAGTSNQLTWAFDGLWEAVHFFQTINIIRYDVSADERYKDFLSQRIRIGTQDLRIAAIAVSKGAILVTRNRRDFNQVPGLRLEDWTIPTN